MDNKYYCSECYDDCESCKYTCGHSGCPWDHHPCDTCNNYNDRCNCLKTPAPGEEHCPYYVKEV